MAFLGGAIRQVSDELSAGQTHLLSDAAIEQLATALGVAAIRQRKRVRFFNAVDLVNQLEQEKLQGKTGSLWRCLMR